MFKRFVEVGRVVLINYGPLAGRLAVIVEIINTSKLLIDGPTTNVRRQEISTRRISLTDFIVEIPRGVKRTDLKKKIEAFKLQDKWNTSAWGRKINRRVRRTQLTDFDRFKVMTLRQRKAKLLHKALRTQKPAAQNK